MTSQFNGPWIVRLVVRGPDIRAMEPLVARTHDELAQILSGLLAAVALTVSTDRIDISVDPGVEGV